MVVDPIDEIRLRQTVTVAGRAKKLLPGVIILAAILALWFVFGR